MASLAFPQLSSGALVQYPFRKRRLVKSPINSFADGTALTSNLNANTQTVWQLSYTDLTTTDQSAIQNHFSACQGPLLGFTFIDPAGNMISYSGNLGGGNWRSDPMLVVTGGSTDPIGGNSAYTVVNTGNTDQRLLQVISAPSNFQYCFSVFACAPQATSIALSTNASVSQSQTFGVGLNWSRFINSSQLGDEQNSFSAALVIPAGQTVVLYGPQLEPQLSPSRYRATTGAGGVYTNAHYLGNSITFESEAPGLFSTLISIETT